MRFAQIAAVALAGLVTSVPAFADGTRKDALSALEPHAWLQGTVSESDVALLTDYLRAAMLAAAEGREVPPPPEELQKRAERLGSELKARGTLGALLMLSALEEKAKALLRGEGTPPPRRTLPPVVPFTRVSTD
jgi:hypothetical protein